MASDSDNLINNDRLLFSEESDAALPAKKNNSKKFKLLIVDDDEEIHRMTRMVLSDYKFKETVLEFFSAYSGEEAKILIQEHPDAALILLDVVMETKDAGLDIVRFIREEKNNDRLRIILRTGQPGKAPEKEVIFTYDINDYKEKTELTTQKLFTSITSALRSYIHLMDLDRKTREIAWKNNRLNDEIAKRIVAESNLTKYNRSLEKMIDTKSAGLKDAILALKDKEKELRSANDLATIGNISSTRLSGLEHSSQTLKKNLAVIDGYRTDMTALLEKYETVQGLFSASSDEGCDVATSIRELMADIDTFKNRIDLAEIVKNYPGIMKASDESIVAITRTISDIKQFRP